MLMKFKLINNELMTIRKEGSTFFLLGGMRWRKVRLKFEVCIGVSSCGMG